MKRPQENIVKLRRCRKHRGRAALSRRVKSSKTWGFSPRGRITYLKFPQPAFSSAGDSCCATSNSAGGALSIREVAAALSAGVNSA
jgi:hypothetical protein